MTGCSSLSSDPLRKGIGLLLSHSPHPACPNAQSLPRPQSTWVSDLQILVLLPQLMLQMRKAEPRERKGLAQGHTTSEPLRSG